MKRSAFTLIEIMLAVLMLALVASAAALSFAKPLSRARAEDAIDQLRGFDAAARVAATRSDGVRIAFDLTSGEIQRRGGRDRRDVAFSAHLPGGVRIDSVKIAGQSTSFGEVLLDVSPRGLTRTYALHVTGPQLDQWLVFAGLTGEMKSVANERTVSEIFEAAR